MLGSSIAKLYRSLLAPLAVPIGGPTFKSMGLTSLWPATNKYPTLTERPLAISRSISRLACSE